MFSIYKYEKQVKEQLESEAKKQDAVRKVLVTKQKNDEMTANYRARVQKFIKEMVNKPIEKNDSYDELQLAAFDKNNHNAKDANQGMSTQRQQILGLAKGFRYKSTSKERIVESLQKNSIFDPVPNDMHKGTTAEKIMNLRQREPSKEIGPAAFCYKARNGFERVFDTLASKNATNAIPAKENISSKIYEKLAKIQKEEYFIRKITPQPNCSNKKDIFTANQKIIFTNNRKSTQADHIHFNKDMKRKFEKLNNGKLDSGRMNKTITRPYQETTLSSENSQDSFKKKQRLQKKLAERGEVIADVIPKVKRTKIRPSTIYPSLHRKTHFNAAKSYLMDTSHTLMDKDNKFEHLLDDFKIKDTLNNMLDQDSYKAGQHPQNFNDQYKYNLMNQHSLQKFQDNIEKNRLRYDPIELKINSQRQRQATSVSQRTANVSQIHHQKLSTRQDESDIYATQQNIQFQKAISTTKTRQIKPGDLRLKLNLLQNTTQRTQNSCLNKPNNFNNTTVNPLDSSNLNNLISQQRGDKRALLSPFLTQEQYQLKQREKQRILMESKNINTSMVQQKIPKNHKTIGTRMSSINLNPLSATGNNFNKTIQVDSLDQGLSQNNSQNNSQIDFYKPNQQTKQQTEAAAYKKMNANTGAGGNGENDVLYGVDPKQLTEQILLQCKVTRKKALDAKILQKGMGLNNVGTLTVESKNSYREQYTNRNLNTASKFSQRKYSKQ